MSKSASGGGVAIGFCPHCEGELTESLAQHMAYNRCEEHTRERPTVSPQRYPKRYDALPTLENHDDREHPDADADIEERRALADELAAAGVWV